MMKGEIRRGASHRQRLELVLTALLPAALGLLNPMALRAGRLAWLAPVLAVPVGLALGPIWRRLGRRDLPDGLERAFGPFLGKATQLVYFLWGLVLLEESARRYAHRLQTTAQGEAVQWLFLGVAFILTLWLGRGDGMVFARAGRLFFLAAAVVLAFALLLSVPGIDWQNLWPPEGEDGAGLPAAALLTLSLSGYEIYILCLPRKEEDRVRAWPWGIWGCALLSALLLAVLGTFGPDLMGWMEEPFLFLLEGVRVPGAFRRGEAALVAVLALADMALLTLLVRGCRELWRSMIPGRNGGGGGVLAAAAFWMAGISWGGKEVPGMMEQCLLIGNLILGILLPAVAVLTIKVRKRGKERGIFSGMTGKEKADIGEGEGDKKSCEENEKKC